MWVATAATIAALLPGWTMNAPQHTADWSDDNIEALVAMAGRLEARPLDLAGCWMSESELTTTARNPADTSRPAVAVGLIQWTKAALGAGADLDAVRRKPLSEQLEMAERYYAPHKGRLVSPGACYLATFLPAYMAHAATPLFVLCSSTLHPQWYLPNRLAFDPFHRGYITVQDLTDRIARVTTGPRWEEFANRVRDAAQDADTLPEIREDNRDTGAPDDGDGATSETFPANDTGDEPPPEAA